MGILIIAAGIQLVLLSILASASFSESPSNTEVALTGTLLLTFLILAALKPRYAIYILVSASIIVGPSFIAAPDEVEKRFFFYYYHLMIGDVKFFLNEMLIIIVGVGILLNRFLLLHSTRISKPEIKPRDSLPLWVLIFILLGSLSILRGIPKYGLQSAFGDGRIVFFSILFFITIATFHKVEHINLLFKISLVSIFIRVLINLLTPFINPLYLINVNLDWMKPFGSGTDAAYMGLSSLSILTWMRYKHKNMNWKGLILAATFITGMLLVTSRSAILAFIISLSVLWLQSNMITKLKYLLMIFSIGIFLFMVIIPNIPAFFLENLKERYGGVISYADDETSEWRLISWAYALEKLRENPVMGQGFGSYAQRWINGRWINVDLHNAYLDIVLRMGLIGLLIFLIIVGKSIGNTLTIRFKRPEYRFNADILFLSIIYLGVFIAFNADMREARAGVMLWIIFGLCYILKKY